IADCRFTDCQLPIADCQLVLLLNLELRYTSNRQSTITKRFVLASWPSRKPLERPSPIPCSRPRQPERPTTIHIPALALLCRPRSQSPQSCHDVVLLPMLFS